MKFGVCCGTDTAKMRTAKKYGFDFVESHCQEIAKLTDEQIEEIRGIGIPVYSANCFIGLRVVGDERDYGKIKEYLETLFSKCSALGLKVLVFGSSGARNIPENQTYEETYSQIVYFLKELVAPLARKYEIKVAIEPLRKAESNIINTVPQGIELAKAVDDEYIRVLADVNHMCEEGENLSALAGYGGMLIHSHTSNPYPAPELGKKRVYPKPGDGFSQESFIRPLIAAGVETCAVEADVIDFESDCAGAAKVFYGA